MEILITGLIETMKHHQKTDRLAKFLSYVLGRQPDEFGLVADDQGWIKLKDLIKALGGEPGWRHVRHHEIRELTLVRGVPAIEIDAERIRACHREHLGGPRIPEAWPKLLYHAVRRRAYPVICEKGVRAHPPLDRIILAERLEMAQRIGHRLDPDPIILIVNCAALLDTGAPLWQYGQQLYLTTELPPQSFSGPPVEKVFPKPKQPPATETPLAPKTPGSYTVDLTRDPLERQQRERRAGKHKNDWKRYRRKKNRSGGTPWRDE